MKAKWYHKSYGEHFKVLEERADWSRICVASDALEAWISNKQYQQIEEDFYSELDKENPGLSANLIDFVTNVEDHLLPVPMGSI